MKVETDVIATITASPINETFKTDVIVFTGSVIMYLTSHWLISWSVRCRAKNISR